MLYRALTICLSVAAVAPAHAQSVAGCRSEAGRICSISGSAFIAQASGEVYLSRAGSYIPARTGTMVGPGQTILTRNGLAQVTLSNSCQTSMPANSMLTISRLENMVCAHQQASVPPAGATTGTALEGGIGAGTLVTAGAAGLVIAGGVVAIRNANNKTLSP